MSPQRNIENTRLFGCDLQRRGSTLVSARNSYTPTVEKQTPHVATPWHTRHNSLHHHNP
ncbi:hypothetical protein T484DRAFT_1924143 [Baffinella frigidus]|nr:hypothetical protein T484DRAFT_1924143 [Cryptophyta sp. CCMP2293]